jgi:hypothetical protein
MTWAIFADAHIQAVGEIIRSGNDRVTAVVGGALLDDTLRRTLSERFREDRDTTKKLLKVNGALGNAGPKIDLLYQLYAFERPVRNALHGVIQVRNAFAHTLDASFDSDLKEMRDALATLNLHDGLKVYPHFIHKESSDKPIEPIRGNREKFLVNLKLGLIALMKDRVSHKTWTNTALSESELDAKRTEIRQLEWQRDGHDGSAATYATTSRDA